MLPRARQTTDRREAVVGEPHRPWGPPCGMVCPGHASQSVLFIKSGITEINQG